MKILKGKRRAKSLIYKVLITKINNNINKANVFKENCKKNNPRINFGLYLYILLLITINLIININLSDFNQRNILMTSSEITLKVKGPGNNIKILSDIFFQNYNEFEVYLEGSSKINDIKIVFYKPMTTTKEMFNNCDKIIEINLSKFDTSLVTDMSYMFAWCGLLSSLVISNIDTSKVINMGSMFFRCLSLNSLNLSNFNTLKVNNTNTMFAEGLLNYLDLSSFDMSNVKSLTRMFYSSKFEYINFKIAQLNK